MPRRRVINREQQVPIIPADEPWIVQGVEIGQNVHLGIDPGNNINVEDNMVRDPDEWGPQVIQWEPPIENNIVNLEVNDVIRPAVRMVDFENMARNILDAQEQNVPLAQLEVDEDEMEDDLFMDEEGNGEELIRDIDGEFVPPQIRRVNFLNDVVLTSGKERGSFFPSRELKNITIGSDFEVFLYDKTVKDVINAKPFVKGKKEKPFNFDASSPFWCTSLDNILAEGNIPPATEAVVFDAHVQKVLDYIASTLPENLCILHEPAWYIKPAYLQNKEARTFGCEPSWNAYTKEMNPSPNNDTNLRSSAFHIHLKYDEMDFETSCELVKLLDLYLGVPSILIEPPNDRRELYGKAGEFRFNEDTTTEYRVLSGFFSKNSDLRTWAFNNTQKTIKKFNQGMRLARDIHQKVQDTINTGSVHLAEDLVERYQIPLLLSA